MKLPYIKEMNGHIPKEINVFLKKLDFKVTFILINETFNLKRLFTFKERQNKLHRSSVVYRITCSCKSTHIGQTSRNLITRLKNHDPNSPNRQDTDVSKHLTDNPDHKIELDKTEIMAQTNQWRKLLITETLLIQKQNPNLNVDRTSIPLYLFNTWVIWIILSPAAASFWWFICLCFVFCGATQVLLKKCCSVGEPLATLCPIWPARDLSLRPPTPQTKALPFDQQSQN